jgi:hypothetical protein
VEQVLAHVRSGKPDDPAQAAAPPPPDALKPRPPAGQPSLSDMQARTPPGPTARPTPAPLKGPAASVPPKGPQNAPSAAAASGAGQPKPPAAPAPPPAAPPAPPPFSVSSLIDEDASWLPPEPERKTAFLQIFRYWHMQVLPENAAKATPAFLFLVSALPVMVKARDDLKALNLWEPPGEHSRQARDLHPAWKKYCEFLPRAQQALQELDAYRHLSLLTGLDDLNARIAKAEKRFRQGVPPPARPGARR